MDWVLLNRLILGVTTTQPTVHFTRSQCTSRVSIDGSGAIVRFNWPARVLRQRGFSYSAWQLILGRTHIPRHRPTAAFRPRPPGLQQRKRVSTHTNRPSEIASKSHYTVATSRADQSQFRVENEYSCRRKVVLSITFSRFLSKILMWNCA